MNLKISLSPNKISLFFKKYCYKIVFVIIIISFLYLAFFLYQYLFLPLSEKKPIDPTLIQSKKEVINQQLWDNITKAVDEKTTSTSFILIKEDPF